MLLNLFKQLMKNVLPSSPASGSGAHIVPIGDKYGFYLMQAALISKDYGWKMVPHKKVTLVNPRDCANLDILTLASIWNGTGHSEWEYIMAYALLYPTSKAIKSGRSTADITGLFNRNLLASKNRVFTSKQIYDHIIKWFEIVSDTEDELKLKIKIDIN